MTKPFSKKPIQKLLHFPLNRHQINRKIVLCRGCKKFLALFLLKILEV